MKELAPNVRCEACHHNEATESVLDIRRLEVSAQQRSPDWFKQRKKMITASEMASVIGQNPYESRITLLRKKLGLLDNANNFFTQHGNDTEDIACQKYEDVTGHRVIPFGLLKSDNPPTSHIGGSPDGITSCGRLVEIKCPVTRKIIPGEVPKHYEAQLQTIMMVSGLTVADFVQYHTTDDVFDITEVPVDPYWYERHKDKIAEFHAMLLECRADPSKISKYYTPKPKRQKLTTYSQDYFDFIID